MVKTNLLKDITIVGLGDLLSQIINIFSAIILIRGLAILDYGSFSAMNSVANLSAGLIGTGINLALVRFSAEYSSRTGKKLTSLYYIVLVVEIFLYLIITLLTFIFPHQSALILLGQPGFEVAIQYGMLYGLGILLTQIGRSIYQAEEKFGSFVFILLVRQGITLLLIFLLWSLNLLSFLNAAKVIAFVYILIGTWFFLISTNLKNFKQLRNSLIDGRGYVLKFLSSTGWLVGYFLLISLISQIDILTMTRFFPKTELAIYGVALRYYSMGLVFLGSINSVLLPKFSHVDMQQPDRQRTFTINWIKISSLLIVPIIIIISQGKPLFIWINGSKYENAFIILIVFLFGLWLSFMFSPLTNILISRGNFRYLFLAGILATIFCLVGNLIMVPLWGGIGAAIITVITHNLVLQTLVLRKVIIG